VKALPKSFYDDSTITVAKNLIGKSLVRRSKDREWVGRIVEVEAYIGEDDPACHAFRGLTSRTRVMYGPPGHAYVYFTYGMYFMLNVVTEREGFPAAVLIRAVEPVSGFSSEDLFPTNGPGKLCKIMKIDKSLNGISLRSEELRIEQFSGTVIKQDIRWSSRIGISNGKDKLWRAYLFGNPHVSRKSNPEDRRRPTIARTEVRAR
jgi:DNA-3-methyladenine glycosylase